MVISNLMIYKVTTKLILSILLIANSNAKKKREPASQPLLRTQGSLKNHARWKAKVLFN